MYGILQEMVYKTRITDLDPLTMPLKNGCCNDDMIQLGAFCSHMLCQLVQIVTHVWYTFFYSISHVINWIQIW